jgi:hypothetical protein
VNHKFQRGQTVFVRIGSRPPLEMVVIECLEGLMYRLDWSLSGFDPLLNAVRIPEKSIFGSP